MCTPLSAELFLFLPTPLAMWFLRHSKRHVIGSLMLFGLWETVSSWVPQEWKMAGFPLFTLLMLMSLGLYLDDSGWTEVWVGACFVIGSPLVWAAWKAAGLL